MGSSAEAGIAPISPLGQPPETMAQWTAPCGVCSSELLNALTFLAAIADEVEVTLEDSREAPLFRLG